MTGPKGADVEKTVSEVGAKYLAAASVSGAASGIKLKSTGNEFIPKDAKGFIPNSCLKNVIFSITFLVCPGLRCFPECRTFRAKTRTVLGKPDGLSVTMLFFVTVAHGLIYKFIVQLIPKLLHWGTQNLLTVRDR